MLRTILLLLFFSSYIYATGQIIVDLNFNLELAEKDSLTSAKLRTSLNAFLTEAQHGKFSSDYVDTSHLQLYEFFFDKISGIGKNSDSFHNPSVVKSYPIKGGDYKLTVSFTGQKEDKPFVFQMTELIARPYQDHYRFYCPFEANTSHFNTTKIKNVVYHHSGLLKRPKAEEFVSIINEFAIQAHGPQPSIDYYSFKDLDELLKSYGFLYSARQCNFLCYDLGFTDNQGQVYMTGTDNENYIFGYLGEYIYYNLPNKDSIYWPFIQGMSTYYGGYGLSYDDMETLKEQFREKLEQEPEVNFLEEFNKGRKSSVNRHFSFYVMSAFLYEEVLKHHDVQKALTLAYSGEEGELFFDNLKQLMDVDESNFHETIVRLIKAG